MFQLRYHVGVVLVAGFRRVTFDCQSLVCRQYGRPKTLLQALAAHRVNEPQSSLLLLQLERELGQRRLFHDVHIYPYTDTDPDS